MFVREDRLSRSGGNKYWQKCGIFAAIEPLDPQRLDVFGDLLLCLNVGRCSRGLLDIRRCAGPHGRSGRADTPGSPGWDVQPPSATGKRAVPARCIPRQALSASSWRVRWLPPARPPLSLFHSFSCAGEKFLLEHRSSRTYKQRQPFAILRAQAAHHFPCAISVFRTGKRQSVRHVRKSCAHSNSDSTGGGS